MPRSHQQEDGRSGTKQQEDGRSGTKQQKRTASIRKPVTRVVRRTHIARSVGGRRSILAALVATASSSAVFGAIGKLADALGIVGADSAVWAVLWHWSGALAMVAAGIALFRLWTPDEGWPARSRGKVIGTVVVLAVAAAFVGYQRPWLTSTGAASPTTTAGQTTTASHAPAIARHTPNTSDPPSRATSTPLRLPHGYGFNLDGATIEKIPNNTDRSVYTDLAFDGADVDFNKTAEVAPWQSAKPPVDADACRTAVTTAGLSPDDNRRAPTKGDAYCFITKAGRVGHLRIAGREGYAVDVDLTLWH